MMKPCDVQFLPTLLYAAKRIRANVTREQLPLLGFPRGGRLGFLTPGIGVDVYVRRSAWRAVHSLFGGSSVEVLVVGPCVPHGRPPCAFGPLVERLAARGARHEVGAWFLRRCLPDDSHADAVSNI